MDLFAQRYKRKKLADNVDFISQLSDDVLLLILSRLPTKEAIRTSVVSKRWEHVWKQISHLVLDTRSSFNSRKTQLSDDSNPDAELTRVINNHYGHLESCKITHYSNKGVHGLLKTWIQKVETRNLKLANRNDRSLCSFPVDFFSHSKLSSLSLKRYTLSSSIPFLQNKNWSNINTLKLLSISCPEVGVFNDILDFCPSLEVLVLNNIKCSQTMGGKSCLEIKNSKLKFLEIYFIKGIGKVILSAPNLDILVAKAQELEFLIQSPNLQFNGTLQAGNMWLHIMYNISKEKNNGHVELVNRIRELRYAKYQTLSVAVDLMNETEVERLRQVMSLMSYRERLPQFRSDRLREFEIKFKGNNVISPNDEIELWVENDHEDPFLNAKFCVNVVVIYNFKASKEEIAFVSCLIRQRKVKMRIMINSNLFSASNRSNIEATVAKLQEVQSEDQPKVTFEYFIRK